VGTAFGNGLGTIIVLVIWNFFRDVTWLLALMIFVAALVLFKLAEEGIGHAVEAKNDMPAGVYKWVVMVSAGLASINRALSPILRYVVPNMSMKPKKDLRFWGLFAAAFTIPFILGFSVGVFLGHMILNIALFISPRRTVAIVKNAYISFLGSLAFIGLAIWGLFEVVRLLFLH